MTKRERDAITRKLKRMGEKIGQKRDELRAIVSDFEGLVSSVEQAEGNLSWGLSQLREAQRSFEDAGDSLSQYV